MSQAVISLFDHSGRFAEPWAAAGYTCYCVDVQHPPGQTWLCNVCLVGGDVRRFVPPPGPIAFIAAFPPCTDLSNAGAHLFRLKGLRALAASLDLVGAAVDLCDKAGAPYILHPPRVLLAQADDVRRITAALQDVIEDRAVTPATIRACFGDVVADAVEASRDAMTRTTTPS